MKLGVVHSTKYNMCKQYNKVISNVRYTMCKKCYDEKKAKIKIVKKRIIVEEYFSKDNNGENSIKHLEV